MRGQSAGRTAWRRGRLAASIFLAAALMYGCAAATPPPSEAQATKPPPGAVDLTPAAPVATAAILAPRPAVPERRLLTLEWPKVMRQDDSQLIRLSLEVDEQGRLTPTTVLGPGHEIRGETIVIPDVYATHNVVAEARLDLAGMQSEPAGAIREPLRPGRAVLFYWSIHARDPGQYRGTVWLYLNFIPLQEGQPEEKIPLTAQLITIQVVDFWGLNGAQVRFLGGMGTVLGLVLSVDGILPWLWKRMRGVR